MNRSTNKFHRELRHTPKDEVLCFLCHLNEIWGVLNGKGYCSDCAETINEKELEKMNKTIAGLQSELKMFYNRHEEIVKMLGHINNEIRLLEEELMKLTTDQPVMNSFDSAESAAQMLGIAKDKTDASDSS